jgi:hypothetical protein
VPLPLARLARPEFDLRFTPRGETIDCEGGCSVATEESQTKAGRNQALFRDVNKRIDRATDGFGVPRGQQWGFLCECADISCFDTIALTHREYEAARRVPTRFPIKAGHEESAVERVVETHDVYVVVEKYGAAAVVAAQADPRRE